MKTLVLQPAEGGTVVPGQLVHQFGTTSVCTDKAAGRVFWSWDDDAPRRNRRRDTRRAVRFVRSLGAITWGAAEDEGGVVTVAGRFGQAQPDLGHAVSDREHLEPAS